ncbi:conjugal transfer protein TraI [Foetidibacter luteolus]|uniref:conjugal transfer protein TraI n=1 Tax=Foetidibacter luteolus TaxID=2608880 RepID=UPI00129A2C6C|nr:conjugal transfer protein TraI [Foetidibacter luteolus]
MKKLIVVVAAYCATLCKADAQNIPGVGSVAGLGTRIVKAIDLKIQRLQNQQIWLQNAQKIIENNMSQLHLKEIGGWVQKQRDMYQAFYDELWQVKSIITHYHRVREIASKQAALIKAYQRFWDMFKQDNHFTYGEIDYMAKVYKGIIDQTLQNADQLLLIVNSFTTQMTDAARITIIDRVAAEVQENYDDLTAFNTQNALLSLQRSGDEEEIMMIRKMYGLSP